MVKNPAVKAGDAGSIPESGGSPGVGNGNPLQYSCLEKPMARGAWRAAVRGVAESDTNKQLTLVCIPQAMGEYVILMYTESICPDWCL